MAWGTAQKFYSYQRKCQAWVSYTQTANTDTSATFSVTGYARSGDGSGYYYAYDFGVTVRISYKVGNGSWTTLGSTTTVLNYGNNVGSTTKTFTVTRTHASQTVQVRCEAISTTSDWDTATSTLSISLNAKTSYPISLNANKPSAAAGSVTNMPANQTKWYGETLTLPSTSPTLRLYNFKGWNTAAAGTGTAYAAGGSYTANSAATLYAQWELAYAYPTIDPANVIRCNSSGTEADDGTYGKVSFTWSIDTTADDGGNTGKRAVISWKPTTTASWNGASSVTITLSGTGGTINRVFGSGAISTDASYDVRIAVTDTHEIDGNECTGYRYLTLSQAFFTLDFLAGGHGVAMGVAATQEDTLEVALDFDHHDGGVTLDTTAKAAWLDALGFELTSTSTASNIITAASGFSITTAGFASYGGIATLSLTIKNTNALTANTTYTVGTIVSGKRPATAIAMTERVGTNVHAKVEIATNGAVTVRPTQAVSANGSCVFHTAMYIIR